MRIRGNLFVGIALLFTTTSWGGEPIAMATPLPVNEWSRILQPSSGPAQPLGFYSSGCIAGASTLPLDGQGYQVMRIFRNRYYGHPSLIAFIQNLGKAVDALGSGILIGDMGQPRGGPLPYGHASHQVGLDTDVWFYTHPEQRIRSLTADERNTLPFVDMLNANGLVDPAKFTDIQIQKLKLASLSPGVERIFVNPAIKTYLCSTLPKSELYWLHNLRPWPGHSEHFHVRLACPADAAECTHQDPQPAGDGCNEVLPPRRDKMTGETEETEFPDPKIEMLFADFFAAPSLPASCKKLLKE